MRSCDKNLGRAVRAMAMGFSTQNNCRSSFCPLNNCSSSPLCKAYSSRSSLASSNLQYRCERRSIMINNNKFDHVSLPTNFLCLGRSPIHMIKPFEISRNIGRHPDCEFLYKVPVRGAFMRFSSASSSVVEEMTEEEEFCLQYRGPQGPQLREVGITFSSNSRVATITADTRLSCSKRRWMMARFDLDKKKHAHKISKILSRMSTSNIHISSNQEQSVSPIKGSDLPLQKIPTGSLASNSKNTILKDLRPLTHGGAGKTQVKESIAVCTDETVSERLKGRGVDAPANGASNKVVDISRNDALIEAVNTSKNGTLNLSPVRKLHVRESNEVHERLCSIYDDVLVIDDIASADKVVEMLTTKYRHNIHACDTEVSEIDVKAETPVCHGEIICFSVYSGPGVDFGGGKSCIWVDILDGGGKDLLLRFAPFFNDPSIKKVWHNYSFDCHVIENYGLQLSGFHADTMHMARLWDSSRRTEGGYSLEALTGDKKVMSGAHQNFNEDMIGKVSMKTIFGRKKVKKDGSEGKITTIPPVEELQREERLPWICYSVLDSKNTLMLYESLKGHLSKMKWVCDEELRQGKDMFDFYEQYWKPFGELLVKMESEGMLVDRAYLAEMENVAKAEQVVAASRFRKWATKYCPDAKYMNVGSDAQLRQLLFGGTVNRKDSSVFLPTTRTFKVPNVENIIEEGKNSPTRYRNIKITSLGVTLPADMYTATGWPAVSGDALKALAGNVSAEYDFEDKAYNLEEDEQEEYLSGVDASETHNPASSGVTDTSCYGTAFSAFETKEEGIEACHAIAALCDVCSIGSLISNFLLPLQGSNISGNNGRIHCSLNINTETGRLSARRPNLQNQPALEKDRYKIRQAFIASPGNSLVVADYGQLELRILAHLASCQSMLDAFKAGGDFHSRTAMSMYPYIREAVENEEVLLEWHPQPGEDKPPVPLLKDIFGSERRKAKMLNFSIAYGKTPMGLAKDWKISVPEARKTVNLWYNDRQEVRTWQTARKKEALSKEGRVYTLLGRSRRFPKVHEDAGYLKGHIERAAINTPVQGSAADVAMCAMLQISKNPQLKELGWKLLLQVHDEVILEGPSESADIAKFIIVDCMAKPFDGKNILQVDLAVDAKCAQNWYAGK